MKIEAKRMYGLVTAYALFVTFTVPATAGTKDPGGGDPRADRFVKIAWAVDAVLSDPPKGHEPSKKEFAAAINRIAESLKPANQSLVIFDPGDAIDCMDEDNRKPGCLELDGKIHIADDPWNQNWINAVEKRIHSVWSC